MASAALRKVIQRAVSDAAFRRELRNDPAQALSGFDLSADEREAITVGDPVRLSSLGIDRRMSKAFQVGGADGVANAVSNAVVSDNTSGASFVIADEPSQSGTGAIVGDPQGAPSADVLDPAGPTHLQMVEQDLNSPDMEDLQLIPPDDAPYLRAEHEAAIAETASQIDYSQGDDVAGADESALIPPDDTPYLKAEHLGSLSDSDASVAADDAGGTAAGDAFLSEH